MTFKELRSQLRLFDDYLSDDAEVVISVFDPSTDTFHEGNADCLHTTSQNEIMIQAVKY